MPLGWSKHVKGQISKRGARRRINIPISFDRALVTSRRGKENDSVSEKMKYSNPHLFVMGDEGKPCYRCWLLGRHRCR